MTRSVRLPAVSGQYALENGCITDDFQIRGAELLLDKIGYDKKEG